MNFTTHAPGINPFDDPLDRILAEIAFSVQLPPSLHKKAIDRYEAVCRFLDSPATTFKGLIEHLYVQGSMAIDATISTRGTDDEYDIDVVLQLTGRFRSMAPLEILKELEAALDGYRCLKIVRQTRCVTLYYSDGMHLDITPSIRELHTPDRQGFIMHAKGPTASTQDCKIAMNAYGFAGWYNNRTPLEHRVRDAFAKRWQDFEESRIRADAEVDDVPDQEAFVVKNTATLGLQLHKRFRNIRYASQSGRMPPSVMLSCYAGNAAQPNMQLTAMVIRIARNIIGEINNASSYRTRLHVANPVYKEDVFTDRWPEAVAQQNEYAEYLKELVHGLEAIQAGEMNPVDMMEWLREQFGALVVTAVADRLADEVGGAVQNSHQSYTRRGGIILPSPGIITGVGAAGATAPALAQSSPHTFFGKKI